MEQVKYIIFLPCFLQFVRLRMYYFLGSFEYKVRKLVKNHADSTFLSFLTSVVETLAFDPLFYYFNPSIIRKTPSMIEHTQPTTMNVHTKYNNAVM